MDYINKDDVVQTKGRIACEIQAADEILTTEILISGMFNKMEPEIIAGVLSSLVFQEGKDESKPSKHNELNEGHKAILEIARKVC